MTGKVIWITGLSGSGKTTLGQSLFQEIRKTHPNTVFIDGDLIRDIVGGEYGHSREDRLALAHIYSRLCRALSVQGLNVVCCTISLFEEIHAHNRRTIPDYFEVFVDCDLATLRQRDNKNIYARAMRGELKNVVGVDLEFDRPKNPHLIIDNTTPGGLEQYLPQLCRAFEDS